MLFRSISATVVSFATKAQLDDALRHRLEGSVQCVGRPTLKRGLMSLIEAAGIVTEDLWPRGRNLTKEMHLIIARRNELIHRGHIVDDLEVPMKDAQRLQAIAERLILRLLGWQQPDWRVPYEAFAWLRHDPP